MPLEAESTPYPFSGVRLKTAAARMLIIEHFTGKQAERSVIVDTIYRHHVSKGGAQTSPTHVEFNFKRALTQLKREGLAQNPCPGDWMILASGTMIQEVEANCGQEEVLNENAPEVSWGERELGTGARAIYVYYLPAYRHLAELKGADSWPCKIGRTDRDPFYRILSQLATAFPEPPRIPLILRTDDSQMLETAIHLALVGRGRKIDDAPGDEWFVTNPDEVESVAKYLRPDLFGAVS
jgi:T5orf172 domain